ncbi:MAG: DUF2309 family protein, partial [Cytophagaceae bacterium]|nr:DUF2309 family protein [Gemmatimonadaceae bacterium]
MSHHATSSSGTPIDAALNKARGILPDQGPLGVFIHHNTLHAFQHLRFAEAVDAASQLNGARPYLDLEEYQAAWQRGRVASEDLDEVLRRALAGEDATPSALGLTRHGFRRLAMLADPSHADPAGTAFLVREDRAHAERALLLAACREVVHRSPPPRP